MDDELSSRLAKCDLASEDDEKAQPEVADAVAPAAVPDAPPPDPTIYVIAPAHRAIILKLNFAWTAAATKFHLTALARHFNMDDQLSLRLAKCALTAEEDEEAQPEVAATVPNIIRLDPALAVAPAFRQILFKLKDASLTNLIDLRAVSKQWQLEVASVLKVQKSLQIFSSKDDLTWNLELLSNHNLQCDDFYKLSQSTSEELIGRAIDWAKPIQLQVKKLLPLQNINKLIISNGANLNISALLQTWSTTIQSLVIFSGDCSIKKPDDYYVQEKLCGPIATMANLTRLELYDIYREEIPVERMRTVLGSLEHFVVTDSFTVENRCSSFAYLKVLLGALVPGKLQHLGLTVRGWKKKPYKELFTNWKHGQMLASELTGLQLKGTTLEMLQVIVKQFKKLQHFNFTIYEEVDLHSMLTILAKLPHLTELRISYYSDTLEVLPPLDPQHYLGSVCLPSICRFSLICNNLLHIQHLSQFLLASLPNLVQLHLSDEFWNDEREEYRKWKAQFDVVPQAYFYWHLDAHKFFLPDWWLSTISFQVDVVESSVLPLELGLTLLLIVTLGTIDANFRIDPNG